MRGHTHLAFALLMASSIEILHHENIASIPTMIAGVSALLPDIDNPYSPIGKEFKPISSLLNKTIKHRTITHSLDFAFGLCLIVLISSYFSLNAWMFALGYMSHLLLDSFTFSGIKLSMFRQDKTIGLRFIRTGGLLENIILLVCSVILLFLLPGHVTISFTP